MAQVKIGSFNAQNLFSRAKVLNLESNKKTASILSDIGKLGELLKGKNYDKAKIQKLYDKVSDYISIEEESGKFWQKRGNAIIGIKANGAADWKGRIAFKIESVSEIAREATAKVAMATKADILCMVETENNSILGEFNRNLLKRKYDQHLLIDSPNDPRFIDVGLLVDNGVIGAIHTHAFDKNDKGKAVFSRDCLRVAVVLASGKTVHVLCNHFKSKSGMDQKGSDARRKAQAERVVEILNDEYDLKKDLVVVLGDFNDTPESDPLSPLAKCKDLSNCHDVLDTPADDRWTYYYAAAAKAKRRTEIDIIYVSTALAKKLKSIEIIRDQMSAVLTGETGTGPGITEGKKTGSWRDAASDHAAIVAMFDI